MRIIIFGLEEEEKKSPIFFGRIKKVITFAAP
jgi:hypothetical protein